MGEGDVPRDELPGSGRSDAPDWRDALVELHVLADHGDPDAARAAAAWMARGTHARRRWESVQAACDLVRGGTATGPGEPAAGPTAGTPAARELS